MFVKRLIFFIVIICLFSCNNDSDSNPEDITPPEITLNGDAIINLAYGTEYLELNAIATDDVDGDISSSIVIGGATVNSTVPNSYVITYDVSDAAGNAAEQVLRTVNVLPDSNQPVITIVGEATIELTFGEPYEELGATAVDDIDGDISSQIVIGGATVDSTIPGIYIITYDVSDAAGNAAEQVSRTVTVLPDTSPPVITLIGDVTIELTFGEPYEELGATAIDDVDGDISSLIVIGGDVVNTNVSGSYVITYNVSDQSGNAAEEVSRTVNVTEGSTSTIIKELHLFSYNQSTDTTSLWAILKFDINGRISSAEDVTTNTEYIYDFDANGKLNSIYSNGTPFIEVFYDSNDRITQINDRTFVYNPNMSDYINANGYTLPSIFSNEYDNFYLEESSIVSLTQGDNQEYTFNILFADESVYNSNFYKDVKVLVFPDGSTSTNYDPTYLAQNKYYIRYNYNDLLQRIGVDYDYESLNYSNSTINPLHQNQTNLLQVFSFLQPYQQLYKTNILFNINLFSNLNIKKHYLDEGPYTLYEFGYYLNNLGMPTHSTRTYLINSGTYAVYNYIEANYYYQGDVIPD
ncbi:MAG: DUF5011 domain-containing protein [Gelidibacter sp.]